MHGPVKLQLRVRVGRMLMIVCAAAAFVGIASVIKPAPRSAAADMDSRRTPSPLLLGIIEGREHTVKCFSTADGPRYSVYTPDGRLLQANLPADEVYRAFPDIDLGTLRADPPSGLQWDSAADWRD